MTAIEDTDIDPRLKYIDALNAALPGGGWVACWRELGLIRCRATGWRIQISVSNSPQLYGTRHMTLSRDPQDLASELKDFAENLASELRRDADAISAMLAP